MEMHFHVKEIVTKRSQIQKIKKKTCRGDTEQNHNALLTYTKSAWYHGVKQWSRADQIWTERWNPM